MIHRIMLAAALLAVPAIVVTEQPTQATQQADTAKPKPKPKAAKKHKKAAEGMGAVRAAAFGMPAQARDGQASRDHESVWR